MKEAKKDLFATVATGADAIVITTNGEYDDDGHAFMGGGCAGVCARLWPQTTEILGEKLKHWGNIPYPLIAVHRNSKMVENPMVFFEINPDICYVLSFPTIDQLIDGSSLPLIEQSTKLLVKMADEMGLKNIFIARPGCGIGGLSWKEVKPVIEPLLDDRFTVVSFDHEE